MCFLVERLWVGFRMKFVLFGCVLLMMGARWSVAEECQICRFHRLGAQFHDGDEAPLRKYAPRRRVDVLHIKIDVTPNFEDRTVSGTTTIVCTPIAEPVRSLVLDAVDLAISNVRCDAASVTDYSTTDSELTIVFDEPIPLGTTFHLEIDHAAEPTKGLYFRTPAMGYPGGDTHVWTQGEPHEARYWFPCFDYPNERSTTEVICHVPKEMTVLSNGERIGETADEAGLKAVQWKMSKPHVSYLICLVAGYFEKLEKTQDGVPLAFFSQPSLAKYAKNSFRDTADIMAFFDDEIGIRFPWNKYYQVTIQDFVAGGMENTTLTTLTHRTIFDEATENIRTSRGLDAHEMAHQWFGDYVTCKDWSHLWLNEGFATYYALLYEGHKFGRDALLYGLYKNATDRVLSHGEDTRPIVYKEYNGPWDQFDYRAYPKGSWVLHMLRSQLGDDLYRECVKTYLTRNALTSVVTEDLNEVFEEVTGRSFDPFFDQWVYHARFPDLNVTYKWLAEEKLAKVTVKQTQKVDDDVLLFQFPTKIRFVVEGENVDHDITIDRAEHEFFFPLDKQPTIVRFDPEYTVLANLTFDKTEKLLLAQIENDEDMIGRILAVEGLGKKKTKKGIAALKRVLNNDPFFGVRIEASKTLRSINNDDAFDVLKDSMQQEDARVRNQVVQDLGKFVRDETGQLLLAVIDDERNPAIRASAIAEFGRFADADARERLLELLHTDSFNNTIADAAIRAMRTQDDPWYANRLIDSIKKRESAFYGRSMNAALTSVAKLSRSKKNRSKTRRFLTSYLNHPKESTRLAAIRALGELGDLKAEKILEPLADADLSERVQQAAEDSLEKIRSGTPPVPQELKTLRKRLDVIEDDYEKLRKDLDSFDRKEDAKDKDKETESTHYAPPYPQRRDDAFV